MRACLSNHFTLLIKPQRNPKPRSYSGLFHQARLKVKCLVCIICRCWKQKIANLR